MRATLLLLEWAFSLDLTNQAMPEVRRQLARLPLDRVVIFGRGRVVRELSGAELSKERIAEQVYNSVAA